MSKSNLINITIPANVENYTKGRNNNKIEEITIHHMAGVLTAEQCGKIFQKKGRNASSHYGIGSDGKIASYVDESDIAWTNSNWKSNCKSVTIETSNSENGGTWKVSDNALNSLIKLVADIAKRNNLGILVKQKNVTWHRMFSNTTCPGEYLLSKMDYIIDEANKINNNQNTNVDNTQAYTIKINTSELNVRDGAGTNFKINTVVHKDEVFTIVEEKLNGETKWGKLKSGAGWISLSYTIPYEITNSNSNNEKYIINNSYKGNSIVEALKEINIDSSFENRKKIAIKNGIDNYTGTAIQNSEMLDKLKSGKLKI